MLPPPLRSPLFPYTTLFRSNVFNHPQFSAYNLTTNVANAAGKTGSAIFANFTGLTATTNLRPAGSTNVLGTYFGELSARSEEHTSELQSRFDLVCRLLLEKK